MFVEADGSENGDVQDMAPISSQGLMLCCNKEHGISHLRDINLPQKLYLPKLLHWESNINMSFGSAKPYQNHSRGHSMHHTTFTNIPGLCQWLLVDLPPSPSKNCL